MKEVVNQEQARKEIDAWLDHKRVKPNKREENKSSIESLIDAVVYGALKVDEKTLELTHVLDFPITDDEGNPATTELKYKPRITVAEQRSKLKGVKSDDADGRVVALVAAISGRSAGIINKLDMNDYSVAQSVAVFFL